MNNTRRNKVLARVKLPYEQATGTIIMCSPSILENPLPDGIYAVLFREERFKPLHDRLLDCCPMSYHQVSTDIARRIARSPDELIVFSQCQFRFKDSSVVVDTPTEDVLDGVRSHLNSVALFAVEMDAKNVLLSLKGVVTNPFPTQFLLAWGQRTQAASVPLLPRLTDDDRAIVVARMTDNKILLATSELGRLEKVNPNDLIGDNLLRFNIPEVFDKYISDLLHHQFLDAYEMPTLDGLGNKKHQTVRAWLTQLNGEVVRVVQVLEDRY